MKKACVIGYPVSHSLSPKLHGFWLKKYGIEGEYSAQEIRPEALADFIKNMAVNGFCGANLTIPHKETVMKLLDELDDTAKAIGAVNLIVVKDGKLSGTNTDAYGFAENIKPHITGKNKAVVLGAGGAARAVIYALNMLGFAEIIITNRTKERAEELLLSYQRMLVSSGNNSLDSCLRGNDNIEVADWQVRGEILKNADLLVNTTSLGMAGKEPLDIDLSELPKTALVTDIVYNPLITPLLAQAQARGNPTVDGLGMLLHQAVPAFAAWFAKELNGRKPEVTQELRDYILAK